MFNLQTMIDRAAIRDLHLRYRRDDGPAADLVVALRYVDRVEPVGANWLGGDTEPSRRDRGDYICRR